MTVAATPADLERVGRRASSARRSRDAGQWRAPRRRSTGGRRRPTAPSCRSRRTTTSGSPSTPRWSPPPTTRSTAGAPAPARPASSSARRPVHHELEAELADWKGTERGACSSPPASPPTSACSPPSAGPDVARRAPTSSTTPRSSTAAAWPARRRRRLPPPRRSTTSTSCCARRTRPRAIVVTDDRVLDGRRRRAGRRARSTCARATARCSCSTRRTRCSARRSTCADDVDVLRVGTLSKTLGSLGGFVAGPAPLVDLLVNRGPRRTSSPPRRRRPTPPPRSPRCAVAALAPRATRCVARLRANVDRLRPGHPSPIVPSCAATRTRALDGRRRAARRGPARPRHPAADGAAGHVAAAGRAVGRPHRRPGRPRSPPRCAELVPGDRAVTPRRARSCSSPAPPPRSARPGGRRRVARELRAGGVHGRRPQAGAVGRPGRRTDRRRRARRRHRRGRPTRSARRTARYPVAMAPPMAADELGRPPFTIADLVGEIALARPASTSGWSRGVGGPRSPIATTATTSTSPHALAPDLVVLVADAGLGTINAVRLSVAALADFPVVVALNRFTGDDPLHARNREHLADRRRLRRGDHAPRARRPAAATTD